MGKIIKLFMCVFLSFLATRAAGSPAEYTMRSPSGKVNATVWTENGTLKYSAGYLKNPLLLPSALQWSVDKMKLGNDTEIVSFSKGRKVKTEYPLIGNHSLARNEYRPYTFTLRENNGMNYQIEFRVYNDGVAFRYLVSTGKESTVDDHTTFRLPAGAECWMQCNRRFYESPYQRYQSGKLPKGEVAGPPVTIKYSGGVYASITEGGLVNFGGMGLNVVEADCLKSCLEGTTRLSGDIATPWRIVMVGTLNDLVNNDIVADVSEPQSPLFNNDLSWVKPGNCVWSWLAGYGVTYENMIRFTDWAAELGIPFQLVDEGWSHWEDKASGKDCWQMVKELINYSAAKGVKIMLWKAYPDRKGIPGIQTPERRRAFFKRCKEMGVAGLKIDFFDEESQTVTKYYEEALRDAAEFGLMINFHGSNKPTGLSRTYPNEVSREGIRGLEAGRSYADQDVIFPFTRFLAGHGDYTPLTFEKKWMGNTTETHQIATTALFLSPLRCYGGRPEDYVKHPARELFLSIPTVWDETIVLAPSEIGECALMAKRKGNDWYVVGAAGLKEVGAVVSLDFLPKGRYEAIIASDNASGQCTLSGMTVDRKDHLTVNMQAGGGYVAKITQVQ